MSIEITPQARIGLKADGPVAQISLNNPPLNVIDIPMIDELAMVLVELDTRPEAWEPIVKAAERGTITLLYSSHDAEHNNAVALRDYVVARLEAAASR